MEKAPVFIDIKKASHTVDHKIILKKLKSMEKPVKRKLGSNCI